jgi:hypothetical protein
VSEGFNDLHEEHTIAPALLLCFTLPRRIEDVLTALDSIFDSKGKSYRVRSLTLTPELDS